MFHKQSVKGAETHYHKIDKISLAIMVTIRKMQSYFSGLKNLRQNQLPYSTCSDEAIFGGKDGVLGGGTLRI